MAEVKHWSSADANWHEGARAECDGVSQTNTHPDSGEVEQIDCENDDRPDEMIDGVLTGVQVPDHQNVIDRVEAERQEQEDAEAEERANADVTED